jgi:hypothetical protein
MRVISTAMAKNTEKEKLHKGGYNANIFTHSRSTLCLFIVQTMCQYLFIVRITLSLTHSHSTSSSSPHKKLPFNAHSRLFIYADDATSIDCPFSLSLSLSLTPSFSPQKHITSTP